MSTFTLRVPIMDLLIFSTDIMLLNVTPLSFKRIHGMSSPGKVLRSA
jgi:hypothetical protein